ncbi:tRNA (adenosine(37)-N6)-threonylcarbamoyltransferase complex transferase subunit TsaD [Lutimonas zeaxanthinifaciens]|uniref:tRNA (adenosine(37)-N6)-threonylcarbamoyltransferase complex transferase subunit TsaD n=1 Tax=Lutimonas zeaxanthinifaciens TaxID=3060215 RepID=UPI00265D48DF|nr:tRNA (adenosine(37)-N6)-threonylcarbamoyltransferase complex transferase subunit TsaD [Lutimonas sp. YSD2104]WKK64999.1 tRNA (adenosine(37)-N6)-threonylcarbamoyltransferase complex transferase subunit TsaD [Lutimonas sp. YSD2104]
MSKKTIHILAIESSCDDTGAAVLKNNRVLSNEVAGQKVHAAYGGVVPELASRAHQQNIVPVVDQALKIANVNKSELDAIAFTRGPGLMGSLLVGTSFAKSLSIALDIPLIPVNHMQAHVLAHFIQDDSQKQPPFPFLCMTISGGHTQILRVNSHEEFEILGETIDDAVGEAFDKTAKLLGLPYPGGPLIDKNAKEGNPLAFSFSEPKTPNPLDFSFSGFKTAILYFLQKEQKKDSKFIENNMNDICASVQRSLVNILMNRLKLASEQTGINHVAIAGGVSANSEIRSTLKAMENEMGWITYIPKFEYTTDNAAMIGIVGYYKYLNKDFSTENIIAASRLDINK